MVLDLERKAAEVSSLLSAKAKSCKTFDEIAKETGLTNVYVAQLFHRQAQLKEETVPLVQKAVPTLTSSDVETMKRAPDRTYNPTIAQEPTIYSYVTVDKVKGSHGEDRVVLTLNGKYLPFNEQKSADNTAPRPTAQGE